MRFFFFTIGVLQDLEFFTHISEASAGGRCHDEEDVTREFVFVYKVPENGIKVRSEESEDEFSCSNTFASPTPGLNRITHLLQITIFSSIIRNIYTSQ